MAICAPNMKKCDPKKKCTFGPNQGKTYNPKDPCCGNGTFNEAACDCELPDGYWGIAVDQLNDLSGTVQPGGCRYGRSFLSISSDMVAQGYYLMFLPAVLDEFTPNLREDGPLPVQIGQDAFFESLPKTQTICTGATFGCDVVLYDPDGEIVDSIGSALTECPVGVPVPCQGCNATLTWIYYEY